MASDDQVTPSREAWAAFLQALAHAVVLNNTRPTNSDEFLRRAMYYAETHPMTTEYDQDTVRATLAQFARVVRQMSE